MKLGYHKVNKTGQVSFGHRTKNEKKDWLLKKLIDLQSREKTEGNLHLIKQVKHLLKVL